MGTGWAAQLQLTNPNETEVYIQTEVIGMQDGKHTRLTTEESQIPTHETVHFDRLLQNWSADRWILISATARLSGSCSFRSASDDHQTCIPLYPKNQDMTHLLFPHLPGDCPSNWSGMALVNPGQRSVAHFTLRNSQDQDISYLLGREYRHGLDLMPWEKKYIRFEGELFSKNGKDTVAWIELESQSALVGMKLYGIREESAHVAQQPYAPFSSPSPSEPLILVH